MKKINTTIFPLILLMGITINYYSLSAQTSSDISALIGALLGESPLEEDLQELCDFYGGRVTGTEANLKSVEWGMDKFQKAGVAVQKEAFTMPQLWVENATTAKVSGDINFSPKVVALSYSRPTPNEGIKTRLLDGGHGTLKDFARLGAGVKGQFILVETDVLIDIDGLFKEYADAVDIEARALEAEAAGVVYMSSRPRRLLYRHNASRGTDNTLPMIVMGREDALRCLRSIRAGQSLMIDVFIDLNLGGQYSAENVIAEIKGSTKPEEVVIIGAHLDSWGLGTGANDNACNVALMIDIARQLTKLGIRPQRTIRFALWNGEEQGMFGSWGYCKSHKDELDQHLMAMSVDIGSGPIIGFFSNGRPELQAATEKLLQPVEGLGPFLIVDLPIVGTDNYDFMMEGIGNLVANHRPASYAINYHAESDTYDKVDLKSLKVNSAIVAALTLGYANMPDTMINWKRQNRSEVQTLIDGTNLEMQMRMFNLWNPWVEGKRGRKE
ncbi:MAG: M20/M25/M40 family metallo-hydrolase [Bacteroidota bacterium]